VSPPPPEIHEQIKKTEEILKVGDDEALKKLKNETNHLLDKGIISRSGLIEAIEEESPTDALRVQLYEFFLVLNPQKCKKYSLNLKKS
jgi:hypothetical protein